MKPPYVWNLKHMKQRTHAKPRNLWSPKSYETTKPLKPSSKHMKPWRPRNLWNHETHEAYEPTKPLKPQNSWNHETHESTKPMKPQNPWNHETDGTSGLCSKLCECTRELENWSRNNRFKLNTEKAKSIFITGTRLRTKIGGTSVNEMRIFTSKGEELDNTTSHKFLGVYVDRDLSFDEHIEQLCKKLVRRIGLLISIRQYLPLNERILFLQHNC